MVWGGRTEEGSGWGTCVYLWRIHVDIWQNQYNIVKLKIIFLNKKIKTFEKSILPSSKRKYNFSSHFKNRLWIIPVKWMKANYCMSCCQLNSEGAWWGMLHQGSRMLSQPKRKHKHTPGPDNYQWNKLISAPLLKKKKKFSRVWGYEGKSPSTQQ